MIVPPQLPGFDEFWRAELRDIEGAAEAIYWARVETQPLLTPSLTSRLCNGNHWGNGWNGPFYCAAGNVRFAVRETLKGEVRDRLRLSGRRLGYVELRPLSAIPCCLVTEEMIPAPGRMGAVAMGGCGPQILIPGRSYVVAVWPRGVQFLGPIGSESNPILQTLREVARD